MKNTLYCIFNRAENGICYCDNVSAFSSLHVSLNDTWVLHITIKMLLMDYIQMNRIIKLVVSFYDFRF